MSRPSPSPKQLAAAFNEANAAARSMDAVAHEHGEASAFGASRRYAGPVVGERILALELIVRPSEMLEDSAGTRNRARIEVLRWPDALEPDCRGCADVVAITVAYSHATASYELRVDDALGPVDDPYAGETLVVAAAFGEAVRESGLLSCVSYEQLGWEDLAQRVAAEAAARAENVRDALRGNAGMPLIPPTERG